MAWLLLAIAGLFEVFWAVGLKYSAGFTRLWPSVGTIAAMIVSFWLLAAAMKSLPAGTAYAIWTGIGAVGTVVAGILFLDESAAPARLLSIALIILGIAGLKFFSND